MQSTARTLSPEPQTGRGGIGTAHPHIEESLEQLENRKLKEINKKINPKT